LSEPIKISNVYLDMIEKAYPYLLGFDCGYDHKRHALFSPATATCSVNLYGIFSKDTDLSKTVNNTLGVYCLWRSKDTNKITNIEDCRALPDTPEQQGPPLINIEDYMFSMDTYEKKMLATKMMSRASLYWMLDDWYPEEEAYLRMEALEDEVIEKMESLLNTEEDMYDDEDDDDYLYDGEDEDEDDGNLLELSDISNEEYGRILTLLHEFDPTTKIVK